MEILYKYKFLPRVEQLDNEENLIVSYISDDWIVEEKIYKVKSDLLFKYSDVDVKIMDGNKEVIEELSYRIYYND